METSALSARLDPLIDESDFSGVVQVARAGHIVYERVRGFAERAHRIPNTRETAFALASGTKSFTALGVMSLIAERALGLDERVQGFLGSAGELVDPAVTVRHLLAHTSGIGDYLDEAEIKDVEDYVLDVPVHRLDSPATFLRFWAALIDGRIVPSELLVEMFRSQSTVARNSRAYGLGFWLAQVADAVQLEGSDPGISFRSAFEPGTTLRYTVISNTTSGAWPVVREIEAFLEGRPPDQRLGRVPST